MVSFPFFSFFFFFFFEDFLYSLSIGSNLNIHRFCPVYSISCGLWNYDGSMVVKVIIWSVVQIRLCLDEKYFRSIG